MSTQGLETELFEILLVDDNVAHAILFREALEEVGSRVRLHVLHDGREVLPYLRERLRSGMRSLPNLIVLDLNMPRKSGFEVLSEIRSDENIGRIPVVILTTSSEEEDIFRAYELGANSYLRKPSRLDEFLSVVASLESFWSSSTFPYRGYGE